MNIEKEIHKNPYHYFQLDSKKQSNQNIISKTLESIKERALAQHKQDISTSAFFADYPDEQYLIDILNDFKDTSVYEKGIKDFMTSSAGRNYVTERKSMMKQYFSLMDNNQLLFEYNDIQYEIAQKKLELNILESQLTETLLFYNQEKSEKDSFDQKSRSDKDESNIEYLKEKIKSVSLEFDALSKMYTNTLNMISDNYSKINEMYEFKFIRYSDPLEKYDIMKKYEKDIFEKFNILEQMESLSPFEEKIDIEIKLNDITTVDRDQLTSINKYLLENIENPLLYDIKITMLIKNKTVLDHVYICNQDLEKITNELHSNKLSSIFILSKNLLSNRYPNDSDISGFLNKMIDHVDRATLDSPLEPAYVPKICL